MQVERAAGRRRSSGLWLSAILKTRDSMYQETLPDDDEKTS